MGAEIGPNLTGILLLVIVCMTFLTYTWITRR